MFSPFISKYTKKGMKKKETFSPYPFIYRVISSNKFKKFKRLIKNICPEY